MVEADFDAIANKIKNRRIEMNMTQAVLASAVGVNPQHIGNIENHRKKVSIYERIETDHEIVKKLIADHDKLWETMAKESQRVMEGAFAEKDKLIEEKEEWIKMLLEKIAEKKAAIPEPISVENSEEDASLEVVPGTVFPEKKSFDTVKTFIGNPDLTASDMKRIMAVCGR